MAYTSKLEERNLPIPVITATATAITRRRSSVLLYHTSPGDFW